MKKILFVITQSEMGGTQRFLATLISHLSKYKYEILVAAGPENCNKYPLLNKLEKEGHKVSRLKHLQREIRPFEDLRACLELKKLIKTFQPNTLFLLSSKAGVLGSFVSKWPVASRKLLVIYRIGGWSFNDPEPWWKKKLWIAIEKLSAHWKDVIIVNNRHDFDQAKRLGIKPRNSLELIHNGLDISELNFLSHDEARLKLFQGSTLKNTGTWHLEPATFLVGTIANFYPAKGLEYLIEAIYKLKAKSEKLKAKFIIIGDGKGRKKLELLIANYQLQDKVFLMGRLDDARQYLKAFDVFVLPSVKEGFPWAILEAMAAGLPVLATRVGAVPEVIEDHKNGLLVDPTNPTQLAEKLQEIITNDSLRAELGIAASQTISQKFSLNKMVESIEKLL